MKTKFVKLITVLILFSIFLSLLSSCESTPMKSSKKALSIVGTVDKYEIPYEEFYFLTHNYRDHLDSVYGDKASMSDDIIKILDDDGNQKEIKLSEHYENELSKLVYENIVSNYAILKLCDEAGLSMDSDDIQNAVQTSLDAYIESNFDGKRSEYKKYIKENGMTDSYVRFSLGVDIMYSRLTSEYLESGVLKDGDDEIRNIIKNDFVRTWHIMILNENGNEKNYQRAEEALQKIQSGATMYEMIGSKYNEDFTLTTTDGYYFTKGGMDPAYEEAAYSLEIGEISGIVSSLGKNSSGDQVDCYYIIQRLELEDQYINKNFETLKSDYYNSTIYDMVEELESSLKFTPNEFGASLDLLNMEKPTQHDPVAIVTAVSISIAVLVVATGAVILLRKRKQKSLKLNKGKNEK